MKDKQKIAVFDFDGTLSAGYISIEFIDYLYSKNLYPYEAYQKQQNLLKECKEGKLSYSNWVYQWALIWAEGLAGKKVEQVNKNAEKFFQHFKKNIYPLSYALIKFFKEKNYHTICLSLGSFEVIKLSARDLGIREVHATQVYQNQSGFYEGKLITNLHEPGGKQKLLERIFSRKEFSKENSFAFGDSSSDIEFLDSSLIKHPIALNPSGDLARYAQEKSWPIIFLKYAAYKDVLNILREKIS